MPEWGNIPIPSGLLGQGVTDMLRITDGRMSGTGFGTVVLHVAPESAVGGPLSRLRDGDMVSLDAYAGSLSVEVDLASREPVVPAVSDRRGLAVLHRMDVLGAPGPPGAPTRPGSPTWLRTPRTPTLWPAWPRGPR